MKNYWLDLIEKQNKMSSRFLAEAREIEKRWERTGLLEDRFNRASTAVLLESQRLCNEVVHD